MASSRRRLMCPLSARQCLHSVRSSCALRCWAVLLAPSGQSLARDSINPPPVGPTPTTPAPLTQDYLVYIVAESADQVHLVRFRPNGAKLEKSQRVGMMPTEINGPHGITVSTDKKYYYVSIAHGTPYGTLWKFATAGDQLDKGRVTLGLFPATVAVTPDGALAFVESTLTAIWCRRLCPSFQPTRCWRLRVQPPA